MKQYYTYKQHGNISTDMRHLKLTTKPVVNHSLVRCILN